MKDKKVSIELWAVINSDDEYFMGSNSWSSDINNAKVYQKKGTARGVVTMYTDKQNTEGHPKLARIFCKNVQVMHENERVAKSVKGINEESDARSDRRDIFLEKKYKQEIADREEALRKMYL